VSPFDTYGTANALHEALMMDPAERHERIEKMKAHIRKADVREWFSDQVEDALKALDSQDKNADTSSTDDAVKSA
jgi:trehalose 6-phosphate synthase